ncbi:MAG: hypothetical protein IJH95_07770 [Mogibacterium sp.]|nr:hypothetical protein [Mogibacterium sp.]
MSSNEKTIYTNELLNDLLNQMNRLNNSITSASRRNKYIYNRSSYLFCRNPRNRISKDEYKQYVAFSSAVTDILSDYGIDPGLSGYTYIEDAVMIILDLNTFDLRLNNDVYPYIAQKHRLGNIDVVEHNIRNAIKSAYRKNKNDPGSNHMYEFEKNPGNKRFLFHVAELVYIQMCETLNSAAG